MRDVRVWVGPRRPRLLVDAIERAGEVVADAAEANVVVWTAWPPDAAAMREAVHPDVEWVQLHLAGVEAWFDEGLIDDRRIWTGAQGVYAALVAEHALAFVLAAARRLPLAARRTRWEPLEVADLAGKTVGIVGAGAIGRETIARLAPFGPRILALTRSGRDVAGADRSLGADELPELLRESDYVVLAAPLTEETRGVIGPRELELLGPGGWILNVGRGALVVTDALVDALEEGRIAGACLDVTEPEPLPEDHPLWRFENVLITPHVANPPQTLWEPLSRFVEENVRRFRDGRDLLGVIDPSRGY